MSLLPRILPDEFLLGYLGRIASLNGCETRREVAQALGVAPRARNAEMDATGSVLSVVSAINGQSPEAMLATHTCHAVARSIGSRKVCVSDRRAHDMANRMAIRNVGNRLRFCPACLEEDRRRLRFSIWRRQHQVPGRYVCSMHGQPLVIAPEGLLAMTYPEDVQHFEYAAEQAELRRFSRNAHIAFVLEFLDLTLRQSLEFDCERSTAVIRHTVLQHGEDPSAPGWHSEFIDRIEAAFPMAWLHLTFPTARFPGGHLRPFYMGWISQDALSFPHTSLAVVASLLFATPEQAIKDLAIPPIAY